MFDWNILEITQPVDDMTRKEHQAADEGAAALRAGQPRDSCPYDEHAQHGLWCYWTESFDWAEAYDNPNADD